MSQAVRSLMLSSGDKVARRSGSRASKEALEKRGVSTLDICTLCPRMSKRRSWSWLVLQFLRCAISRLQIMRPWMSITRYKPSNKPE